MTTVILVPEYLSYIQQYSEKNLQEAREGYVHTLYLSMTMQD